MRYLLVTHIPFARNPDGSALLDRLWADDLTALAAAMGSVRVAAPQIADPERLRSWGPGCVSVPLSAGLEFVGLPERRRRFDPARHLRLRTLLRDAVEDAELVHTSNLFEPDTDLYFAHDTAVRLGKKTLFVVAEDFVDMLSWEWVRPAQNRLARARRRRTLARLDHQVRDRVRTASLTFLHTPAAVERYRLDAQTPFVIRQPAHELKDVLSSVDLDARCTQAELGGPLRLATASRLASLKGLDVLLRSVFILKQRMVNVVLELYGEGPEADALRTLAADLGIAERVRLAGPLASASSLRAQLNQAHVFVMPHLTNDFGRAFFDAMAAGLPVVAFRSPASQDTVRDTVDGLLVSNADAESLAAAIARYACDRRLLRMASANARQRALENTRTFWNTLRAQRIDELFHRN